MPTAPGYADVSVQLVLDTMSRPAFVTFGVDPDATDPTSVASAVSGAWSAAGSMDSILDQSVTMTGVQVSLGTDGGEDISGGITTANAGASFINTLPANCAALIHKRTARGGRRGRGRMFLPWCVPEMETAENGTISSPHLVILQNACSNFLAALNTAGVPMVVLHRPGRTVGGAPNLVTSLTVDPLISTQRRRLGR